MFFIVENKMKSFRLGKVVCTQGIMAAVEDEKRLTEKELNDSLQKHVNCNWGIICKYDKNLNDKALETGDRLVSKYEAESGLQFYIITEWDRSYTTILLPEEY